MDVICQLISDWSNREGDRVFNAQLEIDRAFLKDKRKNLTSKNVF